MYCTDSWKTLSGELALEDDDDDDDDDDDKYKRLFIYLFIYNSINNCTILIL